MPAPRRGWQLVVRGRRLGDRLAAPLVLVVATVAAVATSPAPSPTPAISSKLGGDISLTPEAPVGSVDITVRVAARGGSRSAVTIQGAFEVDGAESATWPPKGPTYPPKGPSEGPALPTDGPTSTPGGSPVPVPMLALIRPLTEVYPEPVSGPYPYLYDAEVDPTCRGQDACEGRFRIVAVLLDPAAGPLTFRWTAEAGSHFEGGTAPPGASITVEPGVVEHRPADELQMAALPMGRLALGVDRPRSVREVSVSVPDVPGADLGIGALVYGQVTSTPGRRVDGSPIEVTASVADRWSSRSLGAGRPWLFVPADALCPDGPPCEATVQVEFDWRGGLPTDRGEIEWGFVGWAVGGSGAGRAPVAVHLVRAAEVTVGAGVTASAPEGWTVSRGVVVRREVVATLHLPPLATGGELRGVARLRVDARTTGVSNGSRSVSLSVGDGVYEYAEPGSRILLVGRGKPIRCRGGSWCEVSFDVIASAVGTEPPDATIAATLYVDVLPEGPAVLPSGAFVDLQIRPVAQP